MSFFASYIEVKVGSKLSTRQGEGLDVDYYLLSETSP